MADQKINSYLQHTLRDDFTSPNPEVRKGAIYALGRLGSGPDVLLILRNIAAQDEDPEVRYTAKKALNYWEGVLTEDLQAERDAVDITWPNGSLHTMKLSDALASPRPGIQIAAVIEAVKLGDAAALAPIRNLLETEQDPWVQSMAVKALGSLGDASEIPVLARHLDDGNHRVVANAIEALEMVGDPDIEAHCARFLDSEDNRVRANAIKAVHPVNPDLAFAKLAQMARNHRPWMRASAIYCLKVLDDKRCEPLLQEMLEVEFAADLTKQLIEALVAQATRASVPVLGLIAETSEDGERQRMARTAYELLLKKLRIPLDEAITMVEARREKKQEARGLASGMFTVGDLDEVEDEEDPAGDAGARAARPRAPKERGDALGSTGPSPGYGSIPTQAMVATEDPGSKQALVAALVLALTAGIYGAYRLAFNPPRVGEAPEATRPPPPPPTIPDDIR